MAGRFRRTRTIGETDIDELGHVNNVVWVQFVIDLAVAHSTEAGFDTAAYVEIGAWWIVHRHAIDYHAPAFPGEEILEETWIAEMRGARCVRESRFRRAGDESPLVSASTTWVFADAVRGRPRRIDKRLLAAFPVQGAGAGG